MAIVKHRIYKGDSRCGVSGGILVRTWAETTCMTCISIRIGWSCKYNHDPRRRGVNAQGNLICMDCMNISSQKARQKRRDEARGYCYHHVKEKDCGQCHPFGMEGGI